MKNIKFIVMLLFVVVISSNLCYGESSDNSKKRIVFISLNRLNLLDYENMDSIGKSGEGFIGLMNIRGAKKTNDASSYASMGWGRKSYALNRNLNFFDNSDIAKSETYKLNTGKETKKISNLFTNKVMITNMESDYSPLPGQLGDAAREKNIKISVIGNSDKEEPLLFSGLIAMDNSGRIEYGNVNNINKYEYKAPYGIKTDYDKVFFEFKKSYETSDILLIEIGDTYRLDEYKDMMDEGSYNKYKANMISEIDTLIMQIKKNLGVNDSLVIASPFPSRDNYIDGYKLAPIYIKNMSDNNIGLLTSDSTRRDGIISNIDFASYIANQFDLKYDFISGKNIELRNHENPWNFLNLENHKIVSISKVRIPVLYTYAIFEMCMWMLAVAVGLLHNKLNTSIINFIKFVLRITLIVPFVLLVIPIFNFHNVIYSLLLGIVLLTAIYTLISKYIKDEMDKIAILSGLTALLLLLDMSIGNQFLIKNSLLGYDAIIGARYYGIGNEYMGILVGSSIITLSILFEKYEFKNSILVVFLFIVVFFMGNPSMGANVGGTITIAAAYLFLILKANNIKIDFKKIIFIFFAIVMIISFMAWLDFNSTSRSHLANTIITISKSGPISILQIIIRKLTMNYKLISASMWSRVLILALLVIGMLFYKPFGILKHLCLKYKNISNGWIAILVGSIIGFMVNDSGVVAAATSICYVVVPMLVLLLNNIERKTINEIEQADYEI